MKKSHLYKKNKLETDKNDITAWKGYRRDIKTEVSNKPTKEPDYSYIQKKLSHDLVSLKTTFANRYSNKALLDREELGIKPEIYLQLYSFGKIDSEGIFIKNLGLEQIYFDSGLSLYIFRQDINHCHYLIELLEKFIQTISFSEISEDLNLIKLIYEVSILDNIDKTSPYISYFNNDINNEIHIDLYKNIEPSDVINIINSFTTLPVEISNDKIIIPSGAVTEKSFEQMIGLCDFIKQAHTEQYLFDLSPASREIDANIKNFSIDLSSNPLFTACILDTGVQNIPAINPFIEPQANLNYSFNNSDYFIDSCDETGHGTGVASIAIYGKQILLEDPVLSPALKICSAKIIDKTIGASETIKGIQDVIENIHLESNKEIRLFNLSFATTYGLKDNEITDLALCLDRLMHKYDILCVISAGNINLSNDDLTRAYPKQWHYSHSNISSPADSISGLTVGSIGYFRHNYGDGYISPYSRKNQYKLPSFYTDTNRQRYRKKPDIVLFGGDDLQLHHAMFSPTGKIVYQSGTSFAAPYATHLIGQLLSAYPTLKMSTAKALILNTASLESFKKEQKFYEEKKINITDIYGNGSIDDKDVTDMDLLYSNEDCVTLIIEDVMDFSQYNTQNFPFATFTLKIPPFQKNCGRKVKITSSLCYNPYVFKNDILSDYNTCFMAFILHSGSDPFKKIDPSERHKNTTISTLTSGCINGIHRWSDIDYNDNIWNNSQVESFIFSKKKYTELTTDGLQITIKAKLKNISEVKDYYKHNPQPFSLVVRIEDLDKEGTLYDEMLALNSGDLSTIQITTAKAEI